MKYLKGTLYLAAGAFSAFYLVNPTAGIIEILPDNLPIVGNLDEVFFTILLLRSLAYFGFRHPALANAEKKLLVPKNPNLE